MPMRPNTVVAGRDAKVDAAASQIELITSNCPWCGGHLLGDDRPDRPSTTCFHETICDPLELPDVERRRLAALQAKDF